MAQFEMFKQRQKLRTVEATLGTVQVFSGLRLLSAVVVVQELREGQ